MYFLAYDSGKTVTNFIDLLISFYKQLVLLLKNIYIRNELNQVIVYFNIIIVCILISALVHIFYKGARG